MPSQLGHVCCIWNKTEVMLFGHSGCCEPSSVDLAALALQVKQTVCYFGFKRGSAVQCRVPDWCGSQSQFLSFLHLITPILLFC